MTIEELRKIIADELGVEADAGTLAYGEIPEWTSARHMNVIFAIEDALGVEFDPDEIVEMTDVPKIEAIVARHLGT